MPFDNYTFQARIIPGLIVFLPLILLLRLFVSDTAWPNQLFSGSVVWILGGALLAQVARDSGKKKEPTLFKKWGGPPAELILSHEKTWLKSSQLSAYHKRLSALIPGISFPNPTGSGPMGDVYNRCVNYLKERTRDKDKFRLIFSENINYGFRRNMWGLKPFAISILLFVVALSGILLLRNMISTPDAIFNIMLSVAFVCFWLFVVSESWVYVPAKAYAERLTASLDNLD